MSDEEQKLIIADHDLLIRIDENLKIFMRQFDDHKDYAIKEMANLNSSKVNKEDQSKQDKNDSIIKSDVETRLRRVEKWGAIAVGIIGAVQFLITVFGN